MNQVPIPRFQGNAIEKDGGWSWILWITMLGDNNDPMTVETKDIFPTKELAIDDLMKAVKLGCDVFQKKFMGGSSGEYIDMKSNETLKWNKNEYN